MTAPFLSVIIPAYNEEQRLPGTLEQVTAFLEQQSYIAEVLVIENGSQDRTYEIAQGFARRYPYLQAVHIDERGKGLAVKEGMLRAGGQYRFMCDSDLSMPITEVNRFLPPLLPDVDIAIASREAPGAVRYDEPLYRHLGGRVVNLVIRILALPGLQDTQCGFKCLRAEVAETLFRQLTLTGWSFDIEMLFIGRKLGYVIHEVPIPWHYRAESKLNVVMDTFRMIKDLLAIRRNDLQGRYRRATPGAPAEK